MNIAKFLRTAFFIEHLRRLLLNLSLTSGKIYIPFQEERYSRKAPNIQVNEDVYALN